MAILIIFGCIIFHVFFVFFFQIKTDPELLCKTSGQMRRKSLSLTITKSRPILQSTIDSNTEVKLSSSTVHSPKSSPLKVCILNEILLVQHFFALISFFRGMISKRLATVMSWMTTYSLERWK